MKTDCPNNTPHESNSSNPPHLFTSVDIRNAGFKIAPVDTNIFPAGWHLLSSEGTQNAVERMAAYLADKLPACQKVGIVAENFSRNEHYWKNVQALEQIIVKAGRQVVVGVTDPEIAVAKPVPNLQHISKTVDRLQFGSETPCIIISNRDFASGAPDEFKNIKQPAFPPVAMGWYRRRKSAHFAAYDQIARKYAEANNFDPWLISTYHEVCGPVDFKNKIGLECVAKYVDAVLAKIATKYAEYGIAQTPYVFVKADSGSFGMGIMTARSGAEVLEVNKNLRKKMSTTKESLSIEQVLIQEGVPTIQRFEGKTAESMVYLVAGEPVDSFLRVNDAKDSFENLNSSGMSFASNSEKSELTLTIARLAAIAAANEV